MKIIGLDVGKGTVTGCQLTSRPFNPREFYRSGNFFDLKLTRTSIEWLLQQKPDVVILEPTGTHYSNPWIAPLIEAGIEVRLVGHDKLVSYRNFLNLPDKTDKADALALACYCLDYFNDRFRFIPVRPPEVARMREISLRLGFYTKTRTRFINRLKQDLVVCDPPKADYRTGKKPGGNPPPFWRWIAGEDIGEKKSSKYEWELLESAGTGISPDLKADGEILLSIFRREQTLERELMELLAKEDFVSYLSVFKEFGFGVRISGILLSQIFPLAKFMGPDGLPEVCKERTTRQLSKRRFKSMMGLAPREYSSGAKMRVSQSGNRLCRKTWWQWCITTLEPKNKRGTPLLEDLGEKMDALKSRKLPVNKARIKICANSCDRLFDLLCKKML